MSRRWILGLSRVQPGDRIEVWDRQRRRHIGTVSQVAPHLGVLWILEDHTGIPKLIPIRDYCLRHAPATQAARSTGATPRGDGEAHPSPRGVAMG